MPVAYQDRSASGVSRPLNNTHLFWSCSRIARSDPPTSSSIAEERTPPLPPPQHGGRAITDARSYATSIAGGSRIARYRSAYLVVDRGGKNASRSLPPQHGGRAITDARSYATSIAEPARASMPNFVVDRGGKNASAPSSSARRAPAITDARSYATSIGRARASRALPIRLLSSSIAEEKNASAPSWPQHGGRAIADARRCTPGARASRLVLRLLRGRSRRTDRRRSLLPSARRARDYPWPPPDFDHPYRGENAWRNFVTGSVVLSALAPAAGVLWLAWRHRAGVDSQPDAAARFLAVAVATLPQVRRNWAVAMMAELSSVAASAARWRFAASSLICVIAPVIVAAIARSLRAGRCRSSSLALSSAASQCFPSTFSSRSVAFTLTEASISTATARRPAPP